MVRVRTAALPALLIVVFPVIHAPKLQAQMRAPLEMPDPIVMPRLVDADRVRSAILTAVIRRKWITEADFGDALVVRLNARQHQLRVRLEYGSREVRFIYMDSENLRYAIVDGAPVIHRKVPGWIQGLALEIERELQGVVFERDRIDVVPRADQRAQPPPMDPDPPPPPEDGEPGLKAGAMALTRAPVALRERPLAGTEVVAELPSAASVQLIMSMRNVDGVWWHVNAGTRTGWLPERELASPD
jgi:hypothetical protein